MKTSILTFLLLLFSAVAHAQSAPTHVHINHGSLRWSWSGTGSLLGFNVRCTRTDITGNPVTTKQLASPALRCIALAEIPLTPGTWACVVDAYNATQTSSSSNTVTLVIENFLPTPTNVTVAN